MDGSGEKLSSSHNRLSKRQINIQASGGSVITGRNTVTSDVPEGTHLPDVQVQESPENVVHESELNISALDSDVSVAENTAVLVKVKKEESSESGVDTEKDVDEFEETSQADSLTSGLTTSDDQPAEILNREKLHFFVNKKGNYVQIGQCCVVVEITVNDDLIEKIKEEGELATRIEAADSVVTIRWGDLQKSETNIKTEIKLNLETRVKQTIDQMMVDTLLDNACEKCTKLVEGVFTILKGRLLDVSLGCLNLTVVFNDMESVRGLEVRNTIMKFEKFVCDLFVTEEMRKIDPGVKCVVTVLDESAVDNFQVTPYDFSIIRQRSRKQSADVDLQREFQEFRRTVSQEISDLQHSQAGEIQQVITQEISELKQTQGAELRRMVSEEISSFQETQAEDIKRVLLDLLPDLQQKLYDSLITRVQISPMPSATESPVTFSERAPTVDLRSGRTIELTEETKEESSRDRIQRLVDLAQSKKKAGQESLPEVNQVFRKNPVNYSAFFDLISPSKKDTLKEEKDLYAAQQELGDEETLLQRAMEASLQESTSGISKDDQVKIDAPHLDTSTQFRLTKIFGKDEYDILQESLSSAEEASKRLDKVQKCASSGLNTVLCMDASRSMHGAPFTKQRELAERLVKGASDNENFGLVVIGGKTTILQSLSCQHDITLKNIARIKVEEENRRTPIIQGLFAALQVLHKRAFLLDVGEHYTIQPRIIFLSDGYFNDCSPQMEYKQTVCEATLSLLVRVVDVMYVMHVTPLLYIVPVTENWVTTSFVETIEGVEMLAKFHSTQVLVGKAINRILAPSHSQSLAQSYSVVKGCLQKLSIDELQKKRIETEIVKILRNPPKIGTRVVLNMPNQSKQTGTIMQHFSGKEDMLDFYSVLVILDDGRKELTIWNLKQKDLFLDSGLKSTSAVDLPVGTLVKRGKDWNYGDQDGGEDEFGVVVINKDEGGLRKVCWRSSNAEQDSNVYRYGDQGKFDIDILATVPYDFNSLINKQFSSSTKSSWEQRDMSGTWKKLPDELSKELLICHLQQSNRIQYTQGGTLKRMLLMDNKLKDLQSGEEFEIRREEMA